jgi:hypothetical protein
MSRLACDEPGLTIGDLMTTTSTLYRFLNLPALPWNTYLLGLEFTGTSTGWLLTGMDCEVVEEKFEEECVVAGLDFDFSLKKEGNMLKMLLFRFFYQ